MSLSAIGSARNGAISNELVSAIEQKMKGLNDRKANIDEVYVVQSKLQSLMRDVQGLKSKQQSTIANVNGLTTKVD